jgi:hypothetical protein
VQLERDRTTLGIALLLAAAAVIGRAYPLISVLLIMLAVFFIAWGRNQHRIEALVGRLPAAPRLLKYLNQLDRIISPRDEQHAKKLLRRCYVQICDLFNESVPEEDINQYIKRSYEILTMQAKLIENEFGEAARVKFLDRIAIPGGVISKAKGNKNYNQMLLELDRVKNNLEELIKTEVWNQTPV